MSLAGLRERKPVRPVDVLLPLDHQTQIQISLLRSKWRAR
jgi:hypothetical protein